jgi:hypothetical protein
VTKFVGWIRGKPDGFKPTSHAANHKRDKLTVNSRCW